MSGIRVQKVSTRIPFRHIILGVVLILMSWYLLPIVKYNIRGPLIALIGFILTVFIYLNAMPLRAFILKLFALISFFSFLYLIIPAGLDLHKAGIMFQGLVMFSTPMIVTYLTLSNKDVKSARFITLMCLVMIFFVFVKTFIELYNDPMVARELARGGREEEMLMMWRFKNVGGLGFAYSIAPLGFLLVDYAIRNREFRLLAVVVAFIISIFIFWTQYTTLLFLYIIGILYIIMRRNRSRIIMITAILGTLFCLIALPSLLKWLAESTQDSFDALAYHISDFSNTLDGGELQSNRGEIASDALNLFLDSPLFGKFNCMDVGSYEYNILLAAHSGVSVMLAQGGVLGFAIYFGFLLLGWKHIRRKLLINGIDPFILDITFVYINAYNIVNSLLAVYELAAITYLIVPLCLYGFQKKSMVVAQ